MDTVIQNLKKTPGRLSRPEKRALILKRVNVISETKRSLRSGSDLCGQDWLLKNISLAKEWFKVTDSALSQLSDSIAEAKKIATLMIDKTSNHEACKEVAKEVEKLFVKIHKTFNSQDLGSYIFACNQSMTPPFRKEEGEMIGQADTGKTELGIEPGSNMRINLVDSSFLTKPLRTLGEDFDLDPGIDPNTRLSDLNLGRGVNLGSIKVMDSSADMSWNINFHCAVTVGDVINTINSSGVPGLSADINAFKKDLKLIYTGGDRSNPGREFSVSEVSGTTAKDLGILTSFSGESTSQAGSLEGQDLAPILTYNTPVSLLKSGQGLTLGAVRITLGRTQRIVDLNSASTIGEIINAINNSIPGVIVSLNSSEKGISVESTVVGKSLVVSDGDHKKSACGLGISGSPDILGGLLFLMEVLNMEDREAVGKSLEGLNLSLEEILTHKAKAGINLKRLENIKARLIGSHPDTPRLLSEVSGADVFRVTTDLATQKTLYQSALQSGTAVIPSTLLDFIR